MIATSAAFACCAASSLFMSELDERLLVKVPWMSRARWISRLGYTVFD